MDSERALPPSASFVYKPLLEKDRHTPAFTAALLPRTKTGKQLDIHPRLRAQRGADTYIQGNVTQPRKEGKNAICSNMDPARTLGSQVSQTEEDESHLGSFRGGISKWTHRTSVSKHTQLRGLTTHLVFPKGTYQGEEFNKTLR